MERRNFSAQFKQQVVRECAETGNVSLVARKQTPAQDQAEISTETRQKS